MMTDELRAAADRVLASVTKIRDGYGVGYENDVSRCQWGLQEPYELAAAYLAEHPADDAELVTEEWLRECGGRDPHGRDRGAPPAITSLGIGFGVFVRDDLNDCWHWCRGVRRLATFRTRGHVRRLLLALGITPKP